MTVHDLHDALNELPVDLILAVDRVRSAPAPKVIHWQRWVSLAAVLALVVGTSLVFARELMPGMSNDKKESAALQAPAAAAPMAPVETVAADEAMPEEAPAQDSASGTTTENGICIDHSHRFAVKGEDGKSTGAYCGNMEVTIDVAGERHVISGTNAVRITDILVNLDYDPAEVCRCMTDITVDTETIKGIHLNTVQGFARCEKGQAALTEEEAQILQDIIDSLQ